MEVKKKNSLVVDRYSPVFREAGIAVALALVLMSFNLKSKENIYEPPREATIEEFDPFVAPITKLPPPKTKQLQKDVQQSMEVVRKLVFTEAPVDIDTVDLSSIDMDDLDIDLPPVQSGVPVMEAPVAVPYTDLSEMPQFPGGQEAFVSFLRKNMKYPKRELQWGVSGKVYLQFTINKKGKVTDVEVMKGATANFDAEALRVGELIPAWTPGKQLGKPVKCTFLVPILFKTRI